MISKSREIRTPKIVFKKIAKKTHKFWYTHHMHGFNKVTDLERRLKENFNQYFYLSIKI